LVKVGDLVRVVAHSGVDINDDAYDMHGWIGIVIVGGHSSVKVRFSNGRTFLEEDPRWVSVEYLEAISESR
jgi:hypothetical protein